MLQAFLLQQDIHLKYSEQINICLHYKLSTMNRGLLKKPGINLKINIKIRFTTKKEFNFIKI